MIGRVFTPPGFKSLLQPPPCLAQQPIPLPYAWLQMCGRSPTDGNPVAAKRNAPGRAMLPSLTVGRPGRKASKSRPAADLHWAKDLAVHSRRGVSQAVLQRVDINLCCRRHTDLLKLRQHAAQRACQPAVKRGIRAGANRGLTKDCWALQARVVELRGHSPCRIRMYHH